MKNGIHTRVLGLFTLLTGLIATPAARANDIFLQIPGVTGESTTDGREGWIEVHSMGFSAARSAGQTSASLGGVSFSKNADSTSPVLFGLVVNGTVKQNVRFEFVRVRDGEPYVFMTVELDGAILEAQSCSGDGEIPQEYFSVYADTVTVSVRKLNPDGSPNMTPGGLVTFSHNFHP